MVQKSSEVRIETTLTIARIAIFEGPSVQKSSKGDTTENLGEKNDLELEIESFAMQYIKRGLGSMGKISDCPEQS